MIAAIHDDDDDDCINTIIGIDTTKIINYYIITSTHKI